MGRLRRKIGHKMTSGHVIENGMLIVRLVRNVQREIRKRDWTRPYATQLGTTTPDQIDSNGIREFKTEPSRIKEIMKKYWADYLDENGVNHTGIRPSTFDRPGQMVEREYITVARIAIPNRAVQKYSKMAGQKKNKSARIKLAIEVLEAWHIPICRYTILAMTDTRWYGGQAVQRKADQPTDRMVRYILDEMGYRVARYALNVSIYEQPREEPTYALDAWPLRAYRAYALQLQKEKLDELERIRWSVPVWAARQFKSAGEEPAQTPS